jgi:ferric-dicitrate binding protein FerR (iron transport regulator)
LTQGKDSLQGTSLRLTPNLMQQQEIDHLIEKYLNGTATVQEEEKLLEWYRRQNQRTVEWIADILDEEDIVKKRVLAKLTAQIGGKDTAAHRRRKLYGFAAAASAAIIVSFSLYFWYKPSEALPLSKVKNERFKNDIPHGSNKATLTLANGAKIILDHAENGVLAEQFGIRARKTREGQVVFDLSTRQSSSVDRQTKAYNTITTPRGGEYQVILPDGSKVWLNAASSLRFPAFFADKERIVELNGEAYFEVVKLSSTSAKNGKNIPFRVRSGIHVVDVLGTHFNIKAYSDEAAVTTTLIEGSVKVSKSTAPESTLLKPGQQAKVGSSIQVSSVDPTEAIAWKDGYFNFSRENIESIMRSISRWYNVDVKYEKNVTREEFVGSVSRYKNVSEVLDMLQLTGAVHFKMEGRRITVMP